MSGECPSGTVYLHGKGIAGSSAGRDETMIKFSRKRMRKENMILAGFMMMPMLFYPLNTYAVEGITLPLEVHDKAVVSVEVPVIPENEDSPFDFTIDPQGLLYETDAVVYGGGEVEEGATILFHNHDGEYDFSRYSDQLTVTNQSNVPVMVTISASVANMGDVRLVPEDDFSEKGMCSMYLALVDDKGNRIPLSEKEDVSVDVRMRQAPDQAYVYQIDEETQSYKAVLSADMGEIDFDTYSFGLEGACDPDGGWQNIPVHPTVTVTWKVEPILPDMDEEGTKEPDTGEEKLIDEPDTREEKRTTGSEGEKTMPDNTEKTDETEQSADDGNEKGQNNVEPDEDLKEDSEEENSGEEISNEDTEEEGKDHSGDDSDADYTGVLKTSV